MLKTIKELFDLRIEPARQRRDPQDTEHALQLATAALLVEVSRADHQVTEAERRTMLDALGRAFDLSADETREIVELAEHEADNAVSLHRFTQLLNEHLGRSEKFHIVELMWRVALADPELDKYEEYYVRKIAELLHVSHGEFIRAKHRVQDSG